MSYVRGGAYTLTPFIIQIKQHILYNILKSLHYYGLQILVIVVVAAVVVVVVVVKIQVKLVKT